MKFIGEVPDAFRIVLPFLCLDANMNASVDIFCISFAV